MKQTYWGLVHTDDDGGFGISFPDFPGCVSAADTMTELVEMGTEALNLHVEGCTRTAKKSPPRQQQSALKMARSGLSRSPQPFRGRSDGST